ncbi:hypothetical protein [uncultured Thiodictyon sp.]|uniref:hypothetical protein n=1 Tax=uncultured Thiodictyon sp. TaxID=1846217 RepID=UPI0025D671C4|nr:hypothetical protein [uncultured Thiodictyon sp.]
MNADLAKSAPQQDAAECCEGPMAAAFSRLADLTRLGPDWDSYGADPIAHACLANVRAVLAALPADTPAPEITPNPNGTLTVDWVAEGYRLSFEIGASRYSACWESAAGVQTDEGDILRGIPAFVSEALAFLRPLAFAARSA